MRDELMREEGVQARGAYKEVPRASRRLALATPESPWACTRVRAKIPLILPPPSLGLAPSPYPNRLLSIYRKISSVKAFTYIGK